MRQLIFALAAVDDAVAARRWYELQRDGLGAAFDIALEATLERLRRTPLAGKPTDAGLRRISLRRFHYEVFYDRDADRVVVILVFHTARNPALALARLRDTH